MTALGFSFLVPAAVKHGGVSLPVAIALELGLAAFLGLAVGIPFAIATRLRSFVAAPVTAAVLLSVAEIVWPAPIPWSFGASLVDGPLVHLASVVGAPGLSLFAYGSAAAVASIVSSRAPAERRARRLGAWCAAIAIVMLWGHFCKEGLERTASASARLSVAVLHIPAGADESARSARELLDRARTAAEEDVSLVVAPETALPGVWPAEELGPVTTANWGPPDTRLVAGAVVEEDGHFYNSAVLFERDGTVAGRYDKRTLLPVAERIPGEGLFPALRRLSPRSGSFRAGDARGPGAHGFGELGISICFEDVLAAGNDPPDEAEVLLNLTNDSWFSGTTEPETHLALARLRAVESGRYLVRATAGGVTSVIDPSGEVLSRIEPDGSGALSASVPRLVDPPLRARLGLLPFVSACCLMLGASTLVRVRSRSSAPS
ncbi:MAG: apolipoprotein N-acyltransferase [Polyangiaceae bacterium]|nr:apolipoprotein N-acyltransferase [Polyangiaceae bacterium]